MLVEEAEDGQIVRQDADATRRGLARLGQLGRRLAPRSHVREQIEFDGRPESFGTLIGADRVEEQRGGRSLGSHCVSLTRVILKHGPLLEVLFTVQKALPLLHGRRVDHPERLDRLDQGDAGVQRLQRHQGGGAVVRPHLDGRPEGPQDPRQHPQPRPDRYADRRRPGAGRRRRSSSSRRASPRRSRSGRMGTRTRSPRSPCSSPPTTAASSPASSCSSTAGWRRSEPSAGRSPRDGVGVVPNAIPNRAATPMGLSTYRHALTASSRIVVPAAGRSSGDRAAGPQAGAGLLPDDAGRLRGHHGLRRHRAAGLRKVMTKTTPEEVRSLFARSHEPLPVDVSINTFLIHTGSKLVLVDAGRATCSARSRAAWPRTRPIRTRMSETWSTPWANVPARGRENKHVRPIGAGQQTESRQRVRWPPDLTAAGSCGRSHTPRDDP